MYRLCHRVFALFVVVHNRNRRESKQTTASFTYKRSSCLAAPSCAPQQVVKSAGVALAWYLASSAAALAVSGATGGAVVAPRPRKKYTALPFLLIAYALSRKDVKERTKYVRVFRLSRPCFFA